jgi:predicted dehydrogenase
MPRKSQVETEDIAVINLRFTSPSPLLGGGGKGEVGALGRVVMFIGPIVPFRFTLRLFGTRGTLDNNRVWLDTTPLFHEPEHGDDFIELPKSWIPDNVQGGISEPWNECMNVFIDDIRLGRKPINDAVSGFNTAAVCFAAVRSAVEKAIVKPEGL